MGEGSEWKGVWSAFLGQEKRHVTMGLLLGTGENRVTKGG